MAYSRVTLAQVKTRLRERQAEFDDFWTEPELEAAINEAVAVWQLLTGDYPDKDVLDLTTPPSTDIQTPTFTVPMATIMRVRCSKTAPYTTFGKALKGRSLFELDKGQYKWRAETTADCPDYWVPIGIDTLMVYPLPTVPTKLEILYLNGEPRLVNTTDYIQVGDEELVRIVDYAQWILSFKEGLKEAMENLDPFKKLFLMAAANRNERLRGSALYRIFMGDSKEDTGAMTEAKPQEGVRG